MAPTWKAWRHNGHSDMEASVPPHNDTEKVEDHAEVGPPYLCNYDTHIHDLRQPRFILLPLKRNETAQLELMFQVNYDRMLNCGANDHSTQYRTLPRANGRLCGHRTGRDGVERRLQRFFVPSWHPEVNPLAFPV
jgi:hypothetical protein